MDCMVEDVASLDSSLATHRPARLTLMAPSRKLIEVMVQAKSPGLDVVPGMVVSNGSEMVTLSSRINEAVKLWGGDTVSGTAPDSEFMALLDGLHGEWQQEARRQAGRIL